MFISFLTLKSVELFLSLKKNKRVLPVEKHSELLQINLVFLNYTHTKKNNDDDTSTLGFCTALVIHL